MSQIGDRIQYYRKLNNLSQSDLASQLYVSTQAVSKWETGNSEPDIDTIAKLAKIFNVTIDDLYSKNITGDKPVHEAGTYVSETPSSSESNSPSSSGTRVIDEEVYQRLAKRQIGVCDDCHRPILEGEVMHKKETIPRHGKSSGQAGYCLCDSCFKKRGEAWVANEQRTHIKRRKRAWTLGIIFASLVFAIMLITGIAEHANTGLCVGLCVGSIAGAYVMLAFVFTVHIDNTFVGEMFVEVASWGFVRMPGVIFGWSFGGIIFLITIKLLFFLISIFIALVAFLFSFTLSAIFSIFVFPLAVSRSYKHAELTHLAARFDNPYRLTPAKATKK